MDQMSEEKARLEKKLENFQTKQVDVEKRMKDLEARIMDRRSIERELKDHLRHRTYQKQLEECEEQLEELRRQQSQVDRASYERQLGTLKAKQEVLIDKVICMMSLLFSKLIHGIVSVEEFMVKYGRCKFKLIVIKVT